MGRETNDRATILPVDDVDEIRAGLKRSRERRGYRVDSAPSYSAPTRSRNHPTGFQRSETQQ
jgi:ActR/RegA family two-component response regulator